MSAILLLLLPSAPCPPPPPSLSERLTPLCHYAAAAFALVAPGDADDSFSFAWEEMRKLAFALEILDADGERYVFVSRDDFVGAARLLRGRYAVLWDAPPLYDSLRFPGKGEVDDARLFNRAYRAHLDGRMTMEPYNAQALRKMQLEAESLYDVWDTLYDAQSLYYCITTRRLALKKLKEKIGDRAYYSGILPPCVPIWLFRRIP